MVTFESVDFPGSLRRKLSWVPLIAHILPLGSRTGFVGISSFISEPRYLPANFRLFWSSILDFRAGW